MSTSEATAPWTTRGLLLMWVTVVVLVGFGAAAKTPCLSAERTSTISAKAMCYTDLPVLYTERGLNLPFGWFGGESTQFRSIEYPPLTVLTMESSATITRAIRGDAPDGATFYWVSVATLGVLGAAAIGTVARMLGPTRSRRFLWVAAPLVIANGFLNWDLLPVFLVVAAIAAWRGGRPALTGVCIGLGTAAKLYPVLLLGAIAVVAIRERRYREAAMATVGAGATWTAVNLPAYLLHPDAWRAFWHFNSTRPADFGSPWYALRLLGVQVPTPLVNGVYVAWMLLACLGVLFVALKAPAVPSVEALALLLVTAFIVMNKVNSPQYVLWLLPLLALACSRWELLGLWCAAEVLYYLVLWPFLTYGAWWLEPLYFVALVFRLAAEVAVAWSVLRQLTSGAPEAEAAPGVPRRVLAPEPAQRSPSVAR